MKKRMPFALALVLFAGLVAGGESLASKAAIESALQTQFSGFAGPAAPTLVWSKTAQAIHDGAIVGVASGVAAVTGEIGEYREVAINDYAGLVSGTVGNLASLPLTPGDWDVSLHAYVYGIGGNTGNAFLAGISTVSATRPATGKEAESGAWNTVSSSHVTIPKSQLLLNSTTTVYAIGLATFAGAGNARVRGLLSARRCR